MKTVKLWDLDIDWQDDDVSERGWGTFADQTDWEDKLTPEEEIEEEEEEI